MKVEKSKIRVSTRTSYLDNSLLRISFVCPVLLLVISDVAVIHVNNDKNDIYANVSCQNFNAVQVNIPVYSVIHNVQKGKQYSGGHIDLLGTAQRFRFPFLTNR